MQFIIGLSLKVRFTENFPRALLCESPLRDMFLEVMGTS